MRRRRDRAVPRKRSGLLLGILLVVGVGVLAINAVVVSSMLSDRREMSQGGLQQVFADERAPEAMSTASELGLALSTLDKRSGAKDRQAVLDAATDELEPELEEIVDKYLKRAERKKIKVDSRIVSSAMRSLEGDRAEVLMATEGTQQRTKARKRENRTPEQRDLRLVLALNWIDDAWLVNGVTFR